MTPTRPPGADDALRESIRHTGVIYPVTVSTVDGQIIDGELRQKLAAELGAECPEFHRRVRNRAAARIAETNALRRQAERDPELRPEILRLAGLRDDKGVGLFTEEAIAAAMGVSLQYTLKVMEGMRSSTHPEVQQILPRYRRGTRGRRVVAKISTWDVPPPAVTEPVLPPPPPQPHTALLYVPEVSEEEYAQLLADIATNGQKEPVVMSMSGQIVDGRARWRACTELGVDPATRTITRNEWDVAVRSNASRLNHRQRMELLARIPLPTTGNRNGQLPMKVLGEIFGMAEGTVKHWRTLAATGSEALVDAHIDGVIRLGTAIRMTREVPRDQWDDTILRMRRIHETGIIPALPRGGEGSSNGSPRVSYLPNRGSRRRRDLVTLATVQQITTQLNSLGDVIDTAESILDPMITEEQAAQALSSLSTARRHIGRLTTLLRERKERT